MSQIETMTFWELAKKYTIEIPIVQRDYAQGRNEPKTTEIRDKFLDDLFDCLTNNKSIELDFVYGKIENNIFVPIDGQQRLTTLFLLHWYIAQKAEKQSKFEKISFSYKTRISARDFCTQLIKNKIDIADKTPSEKIKDASWFFLAWEKDPTVQSMLTMLDSIHKKFKEKEANEIWEKLISEPVISFKFLNLQDFNLSDELYLKMNARGKALSEFEQFKAWLIGYVEEKEKEKKITIYDKEWINKLDKQWTDLFWHFKDKNHKIDNQFMRFFIEMFLLEYAKVDESKKIDKDIISNIQKLANKNETYSNKYFEGLGVLTADSLNFIFKVLNQIIDEKNNLKDFPEIKEYFNFKELFEKMIKNEITYYERVKLYAFLLFVTEIESQNNLFDWIRVVRNIVENTTIDSPTTFASAIKAIHELSAFKNEILESLQNGNCDKIPFFGTQIKEEKVKAFLILKNEGKKDWKTPIIEAENNPFFRGQINFLLENGENCDFDTFVKRKNVAVQLFDKDGVTVGKDVNLLGRVLLSLGLELIKINSYDFDLYLGGVHNQYWKGHLNSHHFTSSILKALDLLSEKNEENFKDIFEKQLKDSLSNLQLPKWKKILIEDGDLFKNYSHYGRIKQDSRGINLYAQQKFNPVTNAILIENNRNEIISEIISSYNFEISQGNYWCHIVEANEKKYYSGDTIKLRRTLENKTIELVFEKDKVKVSIDNVLQNIDEYDFTKDIHSLKIKISEYF